MNAQPILDKILGDARSDGEAIRLRAQERAAEMETATDAAIASSLADTMDRIRRQVSAQEKRMKSMGELEARKADLSKKRILLDEAFALALDEMNKLPADTARKNGLLVLTAIAAGDETIIPSDLSPWCDEAFIAEANQALKGAGKAGQLTLAKAAKALGSGGFLVSRGGMEINCTYRAMMEMERPALEADIALALFS